MKQGTIVAFGASVLAAALLLAVWREAHSPEPDAVSGASSGPGKATMFPPPDNDYELVGVVDGLRLFTVKYDDLIYRGGAPYNAIAARTWKKYGIKTIISITPNDHERKLCLAEGFELVEIEFVKSPGPTQENLDLYLDTVRKGNGPFYVHCHGGTHRGGILGMAYRMHVQNWTFERALVEYGRLGGNLLEDHEMIEVVKNYKQESDPEST
ncbi:MAG: hypothetical protein QGI24_00780 [Kiritimatiellia bacterium]|nr:hypothetical protein [Kiritimatiellia bacterium]MDP6847295.1 hypothetical protein [Kiritimatiellia bacterium]